MTGKIKACGRRSPSASFPYKNSTWTYPELNRVFPLTNHLIKARNMVGHRYITILFADLVSSHEPIIHQYSLLSYSIFQYINISFNKKHVEVDKPLYLFSHITLNLTKIITVKSFNFWNTKYGYTYFLDCRR